MRRHADEEPGSTGDMAAVASGGRGQTGGSGGGEVQWQSPRAGLRRAFQTAARLVEERQARSVLATAGWRRRRRRRCRKRDWFTTGDSCHRCASGSVTNRRRRKNTECILCGVGKYAHFGRRRWGDRTGVCRSCPGGSLARRRATSCKACGNGKYHSGGDDCQSCHGKTRRRRHAKQCTPCSGNSFYSGVDKCGQCWGGDADEDHMKCDHCGPGLYAEHRAGQRCHVCIGGSVRRRSNRHGPENCQMCLEGYYQKENEDDCFACEGDVRRRRAISCTGCGEGKYAHNGNFKTCVACVKGMTRRRRSTSCTECAPGFYLDKGKDNCFECGEGQTRRRDSPEGAVSCTACPQGKLKQNGTHTDDCLDTVSQPESLFANATGRHKVDYNTI